MAFTLCTGRLMCIWQTWTYVRIVCTVHVHVVVCTMLGTYYKPDKIRLRGLEKTASLNDGIS